MADNVTYSQLKTAILTGKVDEHLEQIERDVRARREIRGSMFNEGDAVELVYISPKSLDGRRGTIKQLIRGRGKTKARVELDYPWTDRGYPQKEITVYVSCLKEVIPGE